MFANSCIKVVERTLHRNYVKGNICVPFSDVVVVLINDVLDSVFTLNFLRLFIYPQIILIKIYFQRNLIT